jgi:DNA/RNA-binding domain of Phe-tRNA-synthetase-like protein
MPHLSRRQQGAEVMQFAVHPAVFERFPGIAIAVIVAFGVDNRVQHPQVAMHWREAWQAAPEAARAAGHGNAQSHPRVRAWRERFTALGISGKEFPSSIEALLRRAMKGGEPFVINPLVDFYNAVSLRHTVPVGGFDLAEMVGPLELRLTQVGDRFLALDADAPVEVPTGEVAYADGHAVLTRHFVWRQARTAWLTPATRDVVLVSEVLGEVGAEAARAVLAALQDGLVDLFGASPTAFVVDGEHAAIAW